VKKYLKYLKPIRTRGEYKAALSVLERLFDAKPDTIEGRFVEILALLIEKYEQSHFPIESPTPIEAIKFRMEQLGWSNKELAVLLGGRNRVSEVLSKKRDLSLNMIRVLYKKMGVPAESLIGA
jgi:HTH-type transcriptional regulator / antitoxin HigA